jgi:tetratricopeptide (TPR) repeat protein
MKTMKRTFLLLIILPLITWFAGCGGGGDGGSTPPDPPTDAEVLDDAWSALDDGDLAEAEEEFRRLLSREALIPQALDGLGWTFTVGADPDSALANFRRAAAAGVDTTDVQDQARAGQCFAENAMGHHDEAITAGEMVTMPWSLVLDRTYDGDDVHLTLASSHYMLGDFEDSLQALNQVINFVADVETVEGRAALAAKIEELLNL